MSAAYFFFRSFFYIIIVNMSVLTSLHAS
jgi:hypothetical protein